MTTPTTAPPEVTADGVSSRGAQPPADLGHRVIRGCGEHVEPDDAAHLAARPLLAGHGGEIGDGRQTDVAVAVRDGHPASILATHGDDRFFDGAGGVECVRVWGHDLADGQPGERFDLG